MLESRWSRRGGPVLASIGVLLALAGTVASAATGGDRPPPGCAAGDVGGQTVPETAAWYALDPILERGTLVAQRLQVGAVDGATWSVTLPAEAFATGPVHGRVLYGWDDGRRSTIRRFDAGAGCVTTVGTSDAVVRSAVADPTGDAIHEHRVARADRADLGVWHRAAGQPAQRVLGAIDADARFGRTWRTEVAWSAEGDRLVVATCGEVACRFRIVSEAGSPTTVADPGHGSLVGMADGRLIVRGACRGLPCPVLSVDVERGVTASIADAAGPAVLVPGDGGTPSIAFATGATSGPIRQVDLDGRSLGTSEATLDEIPQRPGTTAARTYPPDGSSRHRQWTDRTPVHPRLAVWTFRSASSMRCGHEPFPSPSFGSPAGGRGRGRRITASRRERGRGGCARA